MHGRRPPRRGGRPSRIWARAVLPLLIAGGASFPQEASAQTSTSTLVLSSNSIWENGEVATLSSAPTAAVTASSDAVAGDFTLSTAATLTFAANATTSADLVTVTAVNNAIHAPDKQVTASGTVASTDGGAISPMAVTLTDDEKLPHVQLVLDPTAISKEGGVSTATATLSGPSSEATTVTAVPRIDLDAAAAD